MKMGGGLFVLGVERLYGKEGGIGPVRLNGS